MPRTLCPNTWGCYTKKRPPLKPPLTCTKRKHVQLAVPGPAIDDIQPASIRAPASILPGTKSKTKSQRGGTPAVPPLAHLVPTRGRAAAARLAALRCQRRALPLREARFPLGQQPLAVRGEALAEHDGRRARGGSRGALARGGLTQKFEMFFQTRV